VNASVKISTPKAFCFGFSEINIEDEDSFVERIKNQSVKRVRFLKSPSQTLTKKLVDHSIYIIHQAVLANGRIELLNYLKEQSITNAYHRYGNLGERDLC
jgi:RHH-type proline utilization regulon transcriptional repressor/proline dehydrogenase/delta 1-pyrroline-5-carboxylate dehydrogenase